MTGRSIGAVLVLVLVLGGLAALVPVAGLGAASPSAPPAPPPLTGNLSGPTVVATAGSVTYYINGSGGPADTGGVRSGTIHWHASVVGSNLTGVSVSPANGTLLNGTPGRTVLSTGNSTQTVTITVELVSSLGTANTSLNLSEQVQVVVPYIVYATLVAGPTAAVLSFTVLVSLDGHGVGQVVVPNLAVNQTYELTYRYATTGLSPGYHTFSLSLADAHGDVAFAGGASAYSTTFYVTAPPPNNSIWYVAGTVAFFGALFIFATRVAARRRGATRR